ncbi:MAG TPA: hypothetical protein PLP23_19980 [Panacibacter sp.]|nr:hypothetical protein [Panacibacter sp.]
MAEIISLLSLRPALQESALFKIEKLRYQGLFVKTFGRKHFSHIFAARF